MLYKITSILLFIFISGCNVLNDISNELKGCNYESFDYLYCAKLLQPKYQGESPSEGEIQGCLIRIYFHEKCKKRLRENSIP